MGKYKKPKVQNLKDQRSLIKPSVSSLNNKSSEVLIEVDGQFHTNTAIQRIINETLEDYKKKLSENKWILSQKQKQHLTLYYTYNAIIKKKENELTQLKNEIKKESQHTEIVQESFFTKLFQKIKNAIHM